MIAVYATIQQFLQSWLVFLADDPSLRMLQITMVLAGFFTVFLVFFSTRDILLRTHSFWYMFFCIVLVAALPVVGFLLYILIRPTRTLKERDTEDMVTELLLAVRKLDHRKPGEMKGGIVKRKQRDLDSEDDLAL